ncbi:MAG TPA: chemotaxis protein CheD [Opitutaceae bacterium]|nr:chemotaxis protein CheD [Opitutaceae bacterium]
MPVTAVLAAPQLFVSVADLRFSNHPQAILSTVALGSCLGVTCYDPIAKIGALLHAMLPYSHKYQDLAPNDARCLDTGIPAVLEGVLRAGANRRMLEFKVFGGAQILAANEYFSIGRQNVDAMKALVAEYGLNVRVWDVGGGLNRSIKLHLATGRVHLRMPNRMEVAV